MSKRVRSAIAGLLVLALLSGCSQLVTPPEAPLRELKTPPVAYDLVAVINTQTAALRLSPLEAPRIMSWSLLAAYTAYVGAAQKGLNADAAAAVAGSETGAALIVEPTRGRELRTLPARHMAEYYPSAVEYGKKVAAHIIKEAGTKGYMDSRAAWDAAEFPGTTRFKWVPTGRGEPGLEPHWGNIKTTVENDCQLAAPTDDEILEEAEAMLSDYDPKKAVGADVMWWLAGTGTPTPSGQWLRIAMLASMSKKQDGEVALQMLASAAVAANDAAILAWREKYRHSVARPETLWKELAGEKAPELPRDTPNHPSFPSGHSAFGGAVATVMMDTMGDIAVFDVLPPDLFVPGERREWPSISAALAEASLSRVHAGFHYPLDTDAGQRLGQCVAKSVEAGMKRLVGGYVAAVGRD